MKSRMTSRGVRWVSAPTRPNSVLEEAHELRLGEGALVAEVAGVDVGELLDEDEQLLVGERLQVDDGREHVREAGAREAPLREAAAQGLVGEDAAAAVLDGLRGCRP